MKKRNIRDTLIGEFLTVMEEDEKRRFIERDGLTVWIAYQTEENPIQDFELTLLSFNKKLNRKYPQEISIRAIFGSKIVYRGERMEQLTMTIEKRGLGFTQSFSIEKGKFGHYDFVIGNKWHIKPGTITSSFNPGETLVHSMGNSGVLIEELSDTVKLLKFNSGASSLKRPLTFDDIVLKLEAKPRI